jgi:gluconate 2-dehydrogenase gamma chain
MAMSEPLRRQKFFGLVGAASAATVLGATAELPAEPAQAATQKPHATKQEPKSLDQGPQAFTFLTPPEQAFIEAATERIIPKDEHSPGARDARVAYYIDGQLAGAWGHGAGQYRQGPWGVGTPEQGYQLNLTPQELYRIGIAETNAYCQKKYGKTLDALSASHQDEVLHGLEGGTITLGQLPAKTFFEMLFNNTVEGFFADPLYRGNHDKIGWKAIGFPGVAAAYIGVIEKYNAPYKATPVGIADVQQGVAYVPDQMHDMDHRKRVAVMHDGARGES